jgi:hypothetical protein
MPVNMTYVQRSIADIGWEFLFPLDHSMEDDSPIGIPEEGHGVVDFVHALKCFLSDQQQIPTLLNDERRAHH